MTVIINGMRYTKEDRNDAPGETLQKMQNALIGLPLTENKTKLTANIVLGVEAEVLSARDSEGVELATENVCTCYALYLYGGGHRVLYHINDDEGPLNLAQRLADFPKDASIKAVIVGGRQKDYESSICKLYCIFDNLIDFDRDIEIVSQRILDRAPKTDVNILTLVFQECILKLRYLYQHLFRQPMPNEIFSDISMNNFMEERQSVFSKSSLDSFVNLLFQMEPFLTEDLNEYIEQMRYKAHFLHLDKAKFRLLMQDIFSASGLETLRELGIWNQQSGATDFCNLYFHHDEEGAVVFGQMIPGDIEMYDVHRRLYLYQNDRFQKMESFYFDGYRYGQYQCPTLDATYIQAMLSLKERIPYRAANSELMRQVGEICNASSDYHKQLFLKSMMDFEPPVQKSLCTFSYGDENQPVKQDDHKRLKMG